MTSERRFEHDLPELLEQLALGPSPDYRNDIVQRTARTRQRPAWMFPERWLPMTAVTSRVPTTAIPWRIVALAALLLLALVMGVLFLVGSGPRLPAPFGPAANGQVAYSANGDIYTVDPLSGASVAVVTGPDTDLTPVWSRDGTHVAFARAAGGGASLLVVARSDGREIVPVSPNSFDRLRNYTFSPDGREILFTAGLSDPNMELWVAKTDGSNARKIDVGMGADGPVYRPPTGSEIVFVDQSAIEFGNGIYTVDVASGTRRTILKPTVGVGRGWVRVSPDGSRLAYVAYTADPTRNTYQVHVVSSDGTGDRPLPMPKGATFQDGPEWSNDGKRLAMARGYATFDQDMVFAVVPADGSGVGTETTKHRLSGCCSYEYQWAPDDSTILLRPNGFADQAPIQQLLWDPATGTTKPAPWDATGSPAWQRR